MRPAARMAILLAVGLCSIALTAFYVAPGARPPLRCVVRIRTPDGSGSGVAVGFRRIVTAAHVVKDFDQVRVDLVDEQGNFFAIDAVVTRRDAQHDLALVETTVLLRDTAVIALGIAERMRAGDPVWCVGSTDGIHPWNTTDGRFTHRDCKGFWQVSAQAWYGNSGGGVFDRETGYLVGMVSQIDGPCITLMVPAPAIEEFLEEVDP